MTISSKNYQAGGFIGAYTDGTYSDCSFDNEKNAGLNIVGDNTSASGIEGADSNTVLANICEDYYESHQYGNNLIVDKQPTCTEAGSQSYHCERCDSKKDVQEIKASGHDFTNYVSNNDATCTKDGTKTANCNRCNMTDTITDEGSMLTHAYKEEWSADEANHWHECKNCDNKTDETKHTFKWVIDKEATSNEKGSKHEECEICGFKKASVEIPATGTKPSSIDKTSKDKTTSPKTSDSSNAGLYTSLLAMSGLLIAILAVLRKKAFGHK